MIKQIGFLLAFSLLLLASCKQDSSATTATEPSVPTAEANTGLTPTTNPLKTEEPAVPVGPITTMSFEESEYDFGTAQEGDVVKHIYNFTNTGSEPLIISNAKATCGCTVPQWPREPIAPGEKGEIAVEFNTKNKGKVGGQMQSKRVTITANTDPVSNYVTIKGKVERSAEQQAKKDAEKAARDAEKAAADAS